MANEAQERAVAKDLILLGASEKKNSSSPASVNRSADPRNRYWNAIQKNVMGSGSLESNNPEVAATFLRLTSTRAATAMAITERSSPIPMRCR